MKSGSPWTRKDAYLAGIAEPAHADWLSQRDRDRNTFLRAIEERAARTGAAERVAAARARQHG